MLVNGVDINRVIIWFSCGVTSAVAAKIAFDKYKDTGLLIGLLTTDTGSEDDDNWRFMCDVAEWIGTPIYRIRNRKTDNYFLLRHTGFRCNTHYTFDVKTKKTKYLETYSKISTPRYTSTLDVFAKDGYLTGNAGARCTLVLKKQVRRQWENKKTDLQVFGFDTSERKRVEDFRKNNPLVNLWTPLLDKGLSKVDCRQILANNGIKEPITYSQGYKNANCLKVGCVKGKMGYWNHIRKNNAAGFDTMAEMERRIGISICKKTVNGRRMLHFLDELQEGEGRYSEEGSYQCGLFCSSD